MKRFLTVRRLLTLGGGLLVAGALVYVAQPAAHVPIYDANLVRLAESNLQGYCAGETLGNTGGEGDAATAAACRETRKGDRPDTPDVAAVPRAFCQAIVDAGWRDGSQAVCIEILTANKLWPTYDGGLTDQWNRARGYPLKAISVGGKPESESRTGDRPGQQRQDDPRGRRGYEGGEGVYE